MMLFAGYDVSRWLCHVHLLGEVTIKEGRFHIHMVNLPAGVCGESKEKTHGLHPRHRREHLLKIYALTLSVSFCDKKRLCLMMLPSGSRFTLKTHFKPIA